MDDLQFFKGSIRSACFVSFLVLACFSLQGQVSVSSNNPGHILKLSHQYPDSALALTNHILEFTGSTPVERNYSLLAKGLVFTLNGVTPHAEKYLAQALEAFTEEDDGYGLAYTYAVYNDLKKADKRKDYLRKALSSVPDTALTLHIQILSKMSERHSSQNASRQAEDLLKKSISLAIRKGDSFLLGNQYNLLLKHYFQNHSWDKFDTMKAFIQANFMKGRNKLFEQQLLYADAYRLAENKDYEAAINKLINGLEATDSPEHLYKAHQLLKKIALKEGDYSGAIYHYQKSDSIKRMDQDQAQNSLGLIETEYESRLKEERLIFLESSARSDSYIRVALILLTGLTLALGLNIYYFQRKRITSLKQLRANEQSQAELERKMLESQLRKERLMQSDLDQEVQHVKEELHDFSKNFIRNDELLNDLRSRVRKLRRNISDPEQKEELGELNLYLQQSLNHDPSRRAFVENALKLDDEFLFKLQSRFPQLTEQDIHLLVFIMLGVETAELAGIYNIERGSIMTKRYRLRKKLRMSNDQTFEDFIKENL